MKGPRPAVRSLLDRMRLARQNRDMRRTLLILVVLLGAVAMRHAWNDGMAYRIADGNDISFSEMMRELRSADVVFLGEIHDVPEHHALQYRVIRTLHEEDVPIAIGLEMFRADDQQTLDAWTEGRLDLDAFIPRYYANWRMPWPLYRDIFLYAREHRIPLVGLNIPERITRTVAERGFNALTPDERAQIPPGVTCTVDARYRSFIREAYSGHGLRSERSFNNFCEVQMVWDRSMARHIASYRERHPDTMIVVLAGVGHAWRRGIPEQLSLYSKLSSRIVLPVIPGETKGGIVTDQDADFLVHD